MAEARTENEGPKIKQTEKTEGTGALTKQGKEKR